jgi:hypothetical protein
MIEFRNKSFLNVLILILGSNVLVGPIIVFGTGSLIHIPGVLLSALILVIIYMRDENVIPAIEVWCAILCIAGLSGLIGSCSAYLNTSLGGTKFGPEHYGPGKLLYSLLLLGVGIFYFKGSRRYIVEKIEPAPPAGNDK